jgi:hypothetical protein
MNTIENKRVVFTLRISEKTLNELKEVAKQEHRSTAQEIEHRLEKSLQKRG